MMKNVKGNSKRTSINRFIVGGIALLIAAIAVPSVIYYHQLKEIEANQNEMIAALKERVEVNVKTYMESAAMAEPNSSTSIESGVITKGNAQTIESATATEISNLITDDVLAKIEGDVLNELYGKVDAVITERYGSTLSAKELNTISKSVSALITEDIYEFKRDVRTQLEGLDNFYANVSEMTGGMQTQLNSLSKDMDALNATYTEQFAALAETDSNLQAQLTSLKAAQNSMALTQDALDNKIDAVSKSNTQLQTELQKRIDALRTNSESSDVELKDTLIKVQKDLNNQIATEDSKVYDNATRIIELTDKITNLDVGMADAIRVLSEQTGSDTDELYSTLAQLQATLDAGDSDLSSAINNEMSERSRAIAEILSLIDSISADTESTQDDIYLQIERKSKALASDLASTSSSMKLEYTSLVETATADLTDLINNTKTALNNKIDDSNETLNNKINTTKNGLDDKINDTDAKLKDKINNTNTTLNNRINDSSASLNNKIDTTNTALNNRIDDSNEALNNKINDSSVSLNNKIDTTNTTLNNRIDDTTTNLTTYIDAENLQTREDMAAAIETLQEEINALRAEVAALKSGKLNISDSTRYTYSTTDGNTIRITVPSTNPNYTR